jgi:hypothetical protein
MEENEAIKDISWVVPVEEQEILKRPKIPYYLGIIFQFIVQIILVITIIACTSEQSRNALLFDTSGIWYILGLLMLFLVVIGFVIAAITVIISWDSWNRCNDHSYLIYLFGTLTSFIIGGGSWLLATIVT